MSDFYHVSVFAKEAVEGLSLKSTGIYVDCTLGGAGHSRSILESTAPSGQLIAIDQDQTAIEHAKTKLADFAGRFSLVHSNFRHVKQIVERYAANGVDGILFDLGVSSPQLDEGERGFSYMQDAPLDMRMDQTQSFSAFELVNDWNEQEITKVIYEYGEERWGKRIAQYIVKARKNGPIQTTGQLVDIIKAAIPAGARREGPHPAKRTFQAFRIAVNDELNVFEQAVKDAVSCLKPGGRISVITFHSLEDRIAKNVFQAEARGCICPPELPVCQCKHQPRLKLITRKPILPTPAEIESNPRARSAKLRIAERI